MNDDAVRQQTLSVVQSYLDLLSAGRWSEWGDLWSDDGVLEFPYKPERAVKRYVGREAIVAYMSGTAGHIKVHGVSAFQVHQMLDPHELVVELQIEGSVTSSAKPYNQRYVTFFKLKDDRIQHYREYFSPLIMMEAIGGYDAYMATFYGDDRSSS
jgi:uncharacterized protein